MIRAGSYLAAYSERLPSRESSVVWRLYVIHRLWVIVIGDFDVYGAGLYEVGKVAAFPWNGEVRT